MIEVPLYAARIPTRTSYVRVCMRRDTASKHECLLGTFIIILKNRRALPLDHVIRKKFHFKEKGDHGVRETSKDLIVGSFMLFELSTWADTGNGSVERPCFLSDYTRPPCTEFCGDRLKGILNRASESDHYTKPMSLSIFLLILPASTVRQFSFHDNTTVDV